MADIALNIQDLLEKTKAQNNDIMIIEDEVNTKKINLLNLKTSMIDDDSEPSDSILYSAQKIAEMYEEYNQLFNQGIGQVQDSLNKLNDKMVTNEILEEKISEINESKAEKSQISELNNSLINKRDINVKITSSDLDTSSNENKIHLENLSDEVLSAMTGETPVEKAIVREGGWLTGDYADNSITSPKLNKSYRFIGHYIEGSIDTMTKDGLYTLASTVEGLPKYDEDETDIRIMEVSRYGVSGKSISQTIYYEQNNGKPIYTRRGLLSNIYSLPFTTIYPITDTFKISNELIGDEFSNRGIIETGNLFDYLVEGNYFVSKGVKNLPTNTENYCVTVGKHDNHYIFTARSIESNVCTIYTCRAYFVNSVLQTTGWYNISTTKKSKFEGKKFHLFGDGICYGLGSDDITNKSYHAILNNKYGYKIYNHSQNDATAGSYDSTYLSERNVNNQIINSSIDDDSYAIIFVGTNDYSSSKTDIGNNTDINEITFKGSLNKAIKAILEKNESTKILMITPLYRSRLNTGDNKNSDDTPVNDLYLRDYINAMIDIGKINHIPVLNLYDEGMINKYNCDIYLKDGLHLNDKYQTILAEKIHNYMSLYY